MKTHHTFPAALAALALLALPTGAQAAGCPNEEFRTGPAASLPDCRAYELVTPEELGRTQAITFTSADAAIPSLDGERFALNSYAPLEPNPDLTGTRAVYSRTPHGWTATSIVTREAGARELGLSAGGVLSPDLSQVAFPLIASLNLEEREDVPTQYVTGTVGGPYTLMANIPGSSRTYIAGANAGTAGVPAFSDVLTESNDHQILPEGPERNVAERTEPGEFSFDLYDWSEGKLRLVNVEGEGATVKMLNGCGSGRLGGPAGAEQASGPGTVGAVSADGSKIFFSSCGRVYMRVDGRETVEISAPAEGVSLNPSERGEARYNDATADGSEVVFNTATPLLEGETDKENKLFIYNTLTRELKLIADNGLPDAAGTQGNEVLISADGSAVYYEASGSIYRYDTQSGQTSFIAAIHTSKSAHEPSYTTPNGQFFVFVSGPGGVEVAGPHGLEPEPRGVGHNELYRYDAADGSVTCVSCGEGVAPAEGQMVEPDVTLGRVDDTPPFVEMSEDGQRVFFQTTAKLVPQDTNSTAENPASTLENPGMDVYEWEAQGTEEAPGVLCRVDVGCTHLISTGEDVGKATFLGASENGENVFFATAGQLVPQADAEFPNIYDARVDGGFPPPRGEPECLSCQGVGAPAPLFSPGASGTFVGPGNAAAPAAVTSTQTKTTRKTVKCGKRHVKRKGRCVKTHGKKVKRASRGAGR